MTAGLLAALLFFLSHTSCLVSGVSLRCETRPTPDCSQLEEATRLPHQFECSKYLICKNNGDYEILDCPNGEQYNDDIKKCEINIKPCYICPSTIENRECPPNPRCTIFEFGVRKPYPSDCTKYIQCEAGVSIIKDCDINQHFSPTKFICMSIEDANCPNCNLQDTTSTVIDTTSTAIDTTSTVIDTTSTAEPTTEEITTTVQICAPIPTCDGIDEHGVLKSYPPDCSKYIYCDEDGTAKIRICLPDLHFNEKSRGCLKPEYANCQFCVT